MTPEVVIPLRSVAERLEKHRDHYRAECAKLPPWRFRDRRDLSLIAAVYDEELRAILKLGGGTALQRAGIDTRFHAPEEPRRSGA